jgi:predicted ATPase
MKKGDESLALAKQLAEPSTSATAAAFLACLHQMCGKVEGVEELSATAIAISTEHDFAYLKAMGTILQGWALTERGQMAEGIAQMRSGLEAFRSVGGVILNSYFSGLLAEALAKAGSPEEGAHLLDLTSADLEPWWAAELHRLKGELILQRLDLRASTDERHETAAAAFYQALTTSQEQKAKSLELRAATSLGRLLFRQGKRPEARSLIADALASFSEGFETPDFQVAKVLLEQC